MNKNTARIGKLTKQQLVKIIQENVSAAINSRKIKEVSGDTYMRAAGEMKNRGQSQRAQKLTDTFLNSFIGKPLLNGEIDFFNLSKDKETLTISIIGNSGTHNIEYQIYNDLYPEFDKDHNYGSGDSVGAKNLSRQDARMLAQIAAKINPGTKYKTVAAHFNIEGY